LDGAGRSAWNGASRHSCGTERTMRGENLTELEAWALDPAGRCRCMEREVGRMSVVGCGGHERRTGRGWSVSWDCARGRAGDG
jgi:hypothetical protein